MPGSDPLSVAHRLLAPRITYLIGTRSAHGSFNLIPVSNVTSVSTDPQHIVVAGLKKWETFRNLMTSPGFTINVPEWGQLEAVWKLGAKYSRFPFDSTEEKLRASGMELDYDRSPHGPVVPSGIGWASCRVISRIDLAGDHGIFVGAVEKVWFNPDFLRPDGTPSGPIKPVMQQTGNHFTTADAEMSTLPYFGEEN